MINSKLLTGIVAGVAVGVIAGILLSPEKGADTREKIMDSTDDLGSSIKDFFVNLLGGKKKPAMNKSSMVPSMSSDLD